MIELSKEQHNIINLLKNNYNIIIDSVAGSGKTTTNLNIGKEFPNKNILLLTYNAKLKFETRKKCIEQNIKNMEVHSYHSFCVKYFDRKCFTDSGIINFLKNKNNVNNNFDYDIILVDEAQDMSPLYFKIVLNIIKYNKNNYQIGIIGDQKQSIFDFNYADSRFIKYGDKIFNLNDKIWKKENLSISFRLTYENAHFINKCCFNKTIINTIKNGCKPTYFLTDSFGELGVNHIYNQLKDLLKIYNPNDIFILAPSLKNEKSPCRQLENLLKKHLKIPIYVPVSDEEKIDDSIINNKLVFSTFHQVKGLERKVVVVYNFDKSYFDLFKKNKNPNVCPNELYVALTRATEKMVLVHHYKNDYLPFINKKYIALCSTLIKTDTLHITNSFNKKHIEVSVTNLIKHLPQEIVDKAMTFLKVSIETPKSDIISIPLKSKQGSGSESISEITGIAIPSYFELKKLNKLTILDNLNNNNDKNIINVDFIDDDDTIDAELPFDLKDINISKITPAELLFISNLWNTKKTGYLFKKYQITNYNWLTQQNLDLAVKRLDNLQIDATSKFEVKVSSKGKKELLNRELVGFIDCISNKRIFEFKCVNILTSEYILQLACYMYLFQTEFKKTYDNYLYNILTNELIKVSSSYNKLKEFVKFLITEKYFTNKTITDKEFLNNITNIKQSIMLNENENKNEINKIMILDTETTGLPKQRPFNPNNTSAYDNARMIELGYIIYNTKGDIIKKYNNLINHNIKINNSFIHGITSDICSKKGLIIDDVLDTFYQDLKECDVLVCHNVDFDKNILLNEIYRIKKMELYEHLNNKSTICTLKKTKELYGKRTKLSDWYKKNFNDNTIQNHRALDDVIMTDRKSVV